MFLRLICMLGAVLASSLAMADDLRSPVARAYQIVEIGLAKPQQPTPWQKPYRNVLLSKRLAGLFARDERFMKESGDIGLLDFDPFINGQDGEVKNLVLRISESGDRKGVVEANFVSFGQPQSVMFDVALERGAWRIDDIRPAHDGGRLSIARMLSRPHDCGAETKKACR